MSENKLILLSRTGCCLCEGLGEKLKNVSLEKLDPALKLLIKDIDGVDFSKSERDYYSLHVPVLLLEIYRPFRKIELPRVSLRLSEEALFSWLQKNMCEKLKKS